VLVNLSFEPYVAPVPVFGTYSASTPYAGPDARFGIYGSPPGSNADGRYDDSPQSFWNMISAIHEKGAPK
jgi:hypothetical protein